MKQIKAPFIEEAGIKKSPEEISFLLDKQHKHAIDQVPWPEFEFNARARFATGHSNNCLFLKFYVKEEEIKAFYTKINDPVYKDSCVEMFLAFNDEKEYYNFEFNLLGTCLASFGAGRENRQLLQNAVISEIKTFSEVKNKNKNQPEILWQLTIMIPVKVFSMHGITALKGIRAKGNFFKCGDDLQKPHFLSWNPITHEKPEFHLPAFFGELHFV